MAKDKEVLREIWDGKLPVCFSLSQEDVQSLQTPEAYYVMASRLSYFPLICEKVKKHFLKHVHPEKQEMEMWLDFNGTPLKWHYPIGVLFDLYSQDIELPWALTVNFGRFPEHQILRCCNKEAIESIFVSTLKEADVLKHRGQVMGVMQKKEHTQLWQGLQYDKFDQFWMVNRKLMETVGNEREFKYIPFRCYRGDESPYVQKLIRPVNEDGSQKLLTHLIQEVYPNDYNSLRVVIHGVEPPLDTPLQWLSEHLSYPDNFLHLCIFSK